MERQTPDTPAKARALRRARQATDRASDEPAGQEAGGDVPPQDADRETPASDAARVASDEREREPRDAVGPDERNRLIREEAYARYVRRGCADGYDVEDWLAAETEVDAQLTRVRAEGAQRR